MTSGDKQTSAPRQASLLYRSNRLRRVAVGALTAAAVVIFFTTAVRALYMAPEEELPQEQVKALVPIHEESATSTTQPTAIGVPSRLSIPSIKVDAKITDVGIGKSGNMAVPRGYTDVGWYRYGPRPGEQGSAVIDGHLDNGFGFDAVFRHLGDLTEGDDIYVTDAKGNSTHFTVVEVQTYPWQQVPLERLFNKKDGAYLNLITCDGTWSLNSLSYDKRLVVFAKRAG